MARLADELVEDRVRRRVDRWLVQGDAGDPKVLRVVEAELDAIEAEHSNGSERAALRRRRDEVIGRVRARIARSES